MNMSIGKEARVQSFPLTSSKDAPARKGVMNLPAALHASVPWAGFVAGRNSGAKKIAMCFSINGNETRCSVRCCPRGEA